MPGLTDPVAVSRIDTFSTSMIGNASSRFRSTEVVEPLIDHGDRVAQVLLAVLAAREIREIGGGARVCGRGVVLVETRRTESERGIHRHQCMKSRRYSHIPARNAAS
jgi:hypothetical protein